MDYKNNKDILTWKRVIQNLQEKTDEGVNEYNKLGIPAKEAYNENYANEQHEQLEYIHHVLQECGDGNMDITMIEQALEYVEDIREQHFNADGSTKSESVNEETVTEGTWSIPDTPEKVRELKDLMKQELPADEAQDKIYGILGDDELFDAIDAIEEKDPKADVRGMIVRRLDDLGLIKKKNESIEETTINYVDDYDTITKIDIEKDGIMYNGSNIKMYSWDGGAKAVLTPEMYSRAKDWDEVHQYLLRFMGKPESLQAAARNVFAMNDEEVTVNESLMISESKFDEVAGEKDACYHKVKARYKIWPSAYASGALTQCRKKGAKNWGNSKK
jgi:hypothetical protein